MFAPNTLPSLRSYLHLRPYAKVNHYCFLYRVWNGAWWTDAFEEQLLRHGTWWIERQVIRDSPTNFDNLVASIAIHESKCVFSSQQHMMGRSLRDAMEEILCRKQGLPTILDCELEFELDTPECGAAATQQQLQFKRTTLELVGFSYDEDDQRLDCENSMYPEDENVGAYQEAIEEAILELAIEAIREMAE